MRQKPDELDRAFIAAFDETDFLGTSELLVARQSARPHPGTTARRAPRVSPDRSARRAPRSRASGQYAGSLLASAIPRCSAKNSSVLTRILSSLNKPLGRPACRRTVSGERPNSSSFRGSVLDTRNRFVIGYANSITLLSSLFRLPHLLSVLLGR